MGTVKSNMIKVMFVCLGNICRSPMAEFIFKDIVRRRGGSFEIASSATSSEEEGNAVYAPAAQMLARHGISCAGKRAVRFTPADYAHYDYILCMEGRNVRSLHRVTGGDPDGKIRRLLDFSDHPRDISDPWYTRDFQTAYDDIVEGCEAFYDYLQREGKLS